MSDNFESLMLERKIIRNALEGWWDRWMEVYRREVGDGDPTAAVRPIDAWALEFYERTAIKLKNERLGC